MEAIERNREQNLVVAFKAAGICPLNKNEALKRIPGGLKSPTREETYSQVSRSFLERLEEQRYGERGAPRRGRTLQVSPGNSWAAPNTTNASPPAPDDEENVDSPDGTESNGTPRRRRRQATQQTRRAPPKGRARNAAPHPPRGRNVEAPVEPRIEPNQGDFVLFKRAAKFSVGQVSHLDENLELAVKVLKPHEKVTFVWPQQPEIVRVDYSEVVKI